MRGTTVNLSQTALIALLLSLCLLLVPGPARAGAPEEFAARFEELKKVFVLARVLGAPVETVRSTYLMALQRGEQLVEKLTGDAALLTPRPATAFGFADEPGGPAYDPELFADHYRVAIKQGRQWSLLDPLAGRGKAGTSLLNDPSEVASAKIALRDDARARVRTALAAGKRILAPPEGSPDGAAVWWEFDPASGTVLGRTEGGHGGATEEIVLIANDAFSLIMTMKGVLACRGLGDLEMACCLLQNAVFGGYGLAVGGNFAKAGMDLWGVAFNVAYSTATAQINLCGG